MNLHAGNHLHIYTIKFSPFTMKACSVLMTSERSMWSVWAPEAVVAAALPSFPSSIDPAWICRSHMNTSFYDLLFCLQGNQWSPLPPPIYCIEGATSQFPWGLRLDILYHHGDVETQCVIINNVHYSTTLTFNPSKYGRHYNPGGNTENYLIFLRWRSHREPFCIMYNNVQCWGKKRHWKQEKIL